MSANLPGGTVTFPFTDIEGSTPLWEREPGPMRLALARHDAILRQAVAAQHGQMYKVIGDAIQTAYRVPSPSLPDGQDVTACELARLFIARAKAALARVVRTPANALALAQICRRLDGIPLAIELAAARVKALSLEQIAARLDNRFQLLTGGSRTALPRQQTLRALIDWRYSLHP